MSSNTVENLLAKIALEFNTKIPFNQGKKDMINRVLRETPGEIQRMTSNFKEAGIDNVVTSENDFFLGVLMSFIYYKCLTYSSFQGNAIEENERPLLQKCLVSNASKLIELITTVTGR